MNETHHDALIEQIERLPQQIERLVAGLTPEQLSAQPLAGEWSVAQNVHHLVDSHINSYIRCKLILTEDQPTLKPYDQNAWAALPDARHSDIAASLALLRSLHARWTIFWRELPADAWNRSGLHPERGTITLSDILATYADHGHAHVDQITRTIAAIES
jgi:hypothetical protein